MKTSLFHCMRCELRVSALLVPLYVCVLSLIFTVLLSMLSYAMHIPVQMTKQLDQETSGIPYIADVSSVYSENAHVLSALSYTKAEITYLSAEQLLADVRLESHNTQLDTATGQITVYISAQHDTMAVTEGRSMQPADNTETAGIIWLSQEAAQHLQVQPGDTVGFSGMNVAQVSLQVAGFFAVQTEDAPLFCLNAATAEQLMMQNNLSRRQICRITFADYTQCRTGMAQLEALGCKGECALFEETDVLYSNVRSLELTFWLISAVLLLCVAIVLYAMNCMLVDYRQRFLGLLRCMGASVRSISLLYGSISLIMVTISVLFSSLCSRLYIKHTVHLLNDYFAMELAAKQLYPSFPTLLIGWIGAALVCIPVFVMLYRRLNRYSAVTVLRHSEREG